MIAGAGRVPAHSAPRAALSRVARPASLVLFGALPAIVALLLFWDAIREDAVAFDFRVFYDAAEAVLRGDSPYQSPDDPTAVVARGYVYPPLTALATVPLTLLSAQAAGLLVMALLVVAVLAVLYALGVDDWRCYGLVLLWPPVISAIQTSSVTIVLALCAALAWRYRDRTVASAAGVGATLAVKTILWPLAVWLAATRRVAAAALAVGIGLGLALASWAVIGFKGLAEYPDVVGRLQDTVELDAYTTYVVALDAGAPSTVARGIWLAGGLGLLAAVVVVARRGGERASFLLALAAALALSPIVWLHYFALLVVVVAVAQPRLGIVWFVPLAMIVTPGSGQPTPFETAATLVVATVTIGLALRASLAEARAVGVTDAERAPTRPRPHVA